MKILICASNMVHIKNFHIPYIERLKQNGSDVKILSSGKDADFNIPFKKSVLSIKNLLLTFKIRKILKKEKFDAVYLHTTLCAFFVRLALKGMKNRPYVINTVHGYLFSNDTSFLKRRIFLFCEKAVRKQTDDVVVMNGEDYGIATKNKLCLNKVFFSHGMGITLPDLPSVEKSPSNKTRLVFVGEISKRKNQEFLVKALKDLSNCTLTLVGDGGERKRIEKLARRLNVSDRLHITGFTKDVYSHLLSSDVYVCASEIEGLPFNIMEAMHAGLPIVASNVKGNRDLLPEKCLYKLNDKKEYIDRILSITDSEMSYDVEKYRLENVINENMKIYFSKNEK